MRFIGCAVGVLLLSTTAGADKLPTLTFADGQWTITRLISLGSKHEQTKPAPTKECLTASAPAPAAHVGWPDKSECTSSIGVTNNTTAEWSFECKYDSTTTTGKGRLTFSEKKFSGTINIEIVTQDESGMAGRRGLLKISGTYVGVCAPTANK